MKNVQIEVPNVEQIEQESMPLVARAGEIAITDQAGLDVASEVGKELKGWIKEIEDTFGPAIKAAHQTHKMILNAKNEKIKPFEDAYKLLKKKAGEYIVAEQKKAEEERRRLEEIARKEAEKKRQEELKAIRAESAKRAKEAENKREAERIKAEAKAEAEAVKAAPVETQKIEATEAPKTKAFSVRRSCDWRVKSEAIIPRMYMLIDKVKINKIVNALGLETDIPGIEVFEKTTTAGR